MDAVWPVNLRHFVPFGPCIPLDSPSPGRLRGLLDLFALPAGAPGEPPREFAVVADPGGALQILPIGARHLLPAYLRSLLSAHEVVRPPRFLAGAAEIHLMAVERLEPLADAPGANDPVFLAGRLYGPFALAGGGAAPPRGAEGRLAVTRADVLEGAVRGAPHAFLSTGAGGAPSDTGRIHHLLLPGDDAEALGRGLGAILAFVVEPGSEGRDNRAVTAVLLQGILCDPREDLRRTGTIDDFLDQGRLALANLREWPSERSMALHAMVRDPSGPPPKEEAGVTWSRLRLLPGGKGWVDHIGMIPWAHHLGPTRIPRRPGLSLPFDCVIDDTAGGGAAGEAFLVLADERSERSIPAPVSANRPDLAALDKALTGAGRAGLLVPAEIPAGRYRCLVRRLFADRAAYVEADGGVWIELVEDRDFRPVLKKGGRGWLDGLGGYDVGARVIPIFPGDPRVMPVAGWIVDEERRNCEGAVAFLLRDGRGDEHCHTQAVRTERQDVADHLNEPAYRLAGFRGVADFSGLPPGLYRPVIRLLAPGGLWCVEHVPERFVKVLAEGESYPAPAVRGEVKRGGRVVYCDPRYPVSWLGDALLGERLAAGGLQPLDADGLRAWMLLAIQEGAAGTCCVMARDIVPDTVCEEPSPGALIRRYLEAGGRVVWPGDVPFYYQGRANGSRVCWGVEGQKGVLGLDPYRESPVTPEVTDEGRSWGLAAAGAGHRSQREGEVTAILARAGEGLASSWLLTFNKSVPGSGFVRCHVGAAPGTDDVLVADLLRLAGAP